jgi:hypothetical protein
MASFLCRIDQHMADVFRKWIPSVGQKTLWTRSAFNFLCDNPLSPNAGVDLVHETYNFLTHTVCASSRLPSKKNWRLRHCTVIDPANKNPETVLEKAVAQRKDRHWMNQMPTCSGLVDQYGRKANVDLVRATTNGYEFIELKIDSNNPLHAAMEILRSGILYVTSRQNAAQLKYDPTKPPLNSANIALVVLAPKTYYSAGKRSAAATMGLSQLQQAIRSGLGALTRANPNLGFTMDFEFQHFPYDQSDLLKTVMGLMGSDRTPVYP